MSAARLREAARVLRRHALDARGGKWFSDGPAVKADWSFAPHDVAHCDGSLPSGNALNATYIALMGPRLGIALADWLDAAGADLWAHGPLCSCAGGCPACDDSLWQPHARRALHLADLILGTPTTAKEQP